MTNRGKVLKALRREGCVDVPVDFILCPSQIDAWGGGHSKGSAAAMHMTRMHCPLRGDITTEDIENYPYPQIKDGEKARITAEVRKNLALCGEKGGIVMAPTHLVEPEVPWENLKALLDECRR